MKTWSFDSPDPEATRRLAVELGRTIGDDGLAIGLIGPLGSGKTVFVKGLAEGLGVAGGLVSSPTFVIAQQYPLAGQDGSGPHVLNHADLYRLESELELESVGFSDFFEAGAVIAVEWADRFPGVLGAERLEILFEGPTCEELEAAREGVPRRGRRAVVEAHGRVAEAILEDWRERVDRADRLEPAAGGEGLGTGPQRSVAWLLSFALLLWAIAQLDSARPLEICSNPQGLELDVWGTRRVLCREESSECAAPEGVGGLLFGLPLSLDRVTVTQLETLPGIGPSRARAIVATRAEASFERVEDLERVPGIGPKIRARVAPWLAARETAARPSDFCTQLPRMPGVRSGEDHG